jgi:hypothetical protein
MASVFEHCGGDPREAISMFMSMVLGIIISAHEGNMDAAAAHFEQIAKSVCEELRGDEDDEGEEKPAPVTVH